MACTMPIEGVLLSCAIATWFCCCILYLSVYSVTMFPVMMFFIRILHCSHAHLCCISLILSASFLCTVFIPLPSFQLLLKISIVPQMQQCSGVILALRFSCHSSWSKCVLVMWSHDELDYQFGSDATVHWNLPAFRWSDQTALGINRCMWFRCEHNQWALPCQCQHPHGEYSVVLRVGSPRRLALCLWCMIWESAEMNVFEVAIGKYKVCAPHYQTCFVSSPSGIRFSTKKCILILKRCSVITKE